MKNVAKVFAALTSVALFLGAMTGCSSTTTNGDPSSKQTAEQTSETEEEQPNVTEEAGSAEGSESTANESTDGKVYKIGVMQLVQHDALDAAYQGFHDKLVELGLNFEEDYQNAQGDASNQKTIAQRFVSNEVDLVLAVATSSAQTMANETSTIPIIGTAITDYVSAELIETNEKPGGNVTGSTDMNPISEQIDLIQALVPEITKVGILYSASEINSQVQIDIATGIFEERNIAVELGTITTVNDIQQVAQSLISKDIQAMYIPTDNNVASAMPTLVGITEKAGIPVIGGEEMQVRNGATATIGISYYRIGELAGEMAYEILVNATNPADMPIRALDTYDFVYNQDSAVALNIEIPEEWKSKAAQVYTNDDAEAQS